MDDLWHIKTQLALQELNATFVHALDHNQIETLVDLFTEDAVYTHGERRSEGREAIRQLFTRRRDAGVRTVRHLQTGLRLQIGEFTARGQSVCTTFAADAPPPVSPATPYLVADFDDHYRWDDDGRWRIAVRNIRRIFLAADNPGPVGTIDPGVSP